MLPPTLLPKDAAIIHRIVSFLFKHFTENTANAITRFQQGLNAVQPNQYLKHVTDSVVLMLRSTDSGSIDKVTIARDHLNEIEKRTDKSAAAKDALHVLINFLRASTFWHATSSNHMLITGLLDKGEIKDFSATLTAGGSEIAWQLEMALQRQAMTTEATTEPAASDASPPLAVDESADIHPSAVSTPSLEADAEQKGPLPPGSPLLASPKPPCYAAPYRGKYCKNIRAGWFLGISRSDSADTKPPKPDSDDSNGGAPRSPSPMSAGL